MGFPFDTIYIIVKFVSRLNAFILNYERMKVPFTAL